MRVKVVNTCDMSEASSVVVALLAQVQKELDFLSSKKFNYWQVSELLMQIESMRESLANIDHGLGDASNIASGWLEAYLDEAKEPIEGLADSVQDNNEVTDASEN